MNSAPGPVPTPRRLYQVESTFRAMVTVMILGLMLAAGIWWVIQPQPNMTLPVEPSMTVLYAPWLSAGGLGLAAVAGSFLAGRYLLVKKILGHGAVITGTVELLERRDTNMHSKTSQGHLNTTPTYVYYVTIRYGIHGIERKFRTALPNSPSTYGLKEGGEVDLVALDGMPNKPLIRAVYLGRTGN